jgi:hypothetical protein
VQIIERLSTTHKQERRLVKKHLSIYTYYFSFLSYEVRFYYARTIASFKNLSNDLQKQAKLLANIKINTLGNRAEDSFLISAKQQQALNTAQIDALRDNLAKL